MNRDDLGRLVRETWAKYCIETGDDQPSHLVPYDDLSEHDKEADRRIGEALESAMLKEFAGVLAMIGIGRLEVEDRATP